MKQPNQQFYERALAHYNDRLGAVGQRLRAQQALVIALSSVCMVLVGLTSYFGYVNANRPVEIMKVPVAAGTATGTSQVVGVTTSRSERDSRLVEQALNNYIKRLKSVPGDADMIVANLSQVQTMSSALVVKFIKDYFRPDVTTSPTLPFNISLRYRVTVDVKTVLKVTDTTYRADWVETYKDAQSGLTLKTERWNSTLSFSLLRPEEVPQQMDRLDNPLALMVTDIQWAKEQ